MATEADILAPICEARGEQGGILADQATISLAKHLFQSDAHNGLPTIEGDNFLTPPSIAEVHCEKPNQTGTEGDGFGSARNAQDNLEAESFQTAENTSSFVKEDEQIEYPAASLHGSSGNVEASYLGEEISTKSSAEDQTPTGNLRENTGGETVETQKEYLEKFPAENVKEDSEIKSDGSETKHKDIEDEELTKAALNENAERTGQNIESQIERETTSCIEEQSATTHLQKIPNKKIEDGTIDEGVTKEETPDVQEEEQGGNLVEQTTDNSIEELPSEEQCVTDTHNGLPAVEGENFLRPLSTGEVHCEGDSNAPDFGKVTEERNHTAKSDDQPLEVDANEERSSGEIEQNAEESKGSAEDEAKELILEGDELNVQGEKTDEKTVDGKATEEDIPCDLTRDVPEGEENRSTLLKEDAQIENPSESLHEDQSANAYLHEGTGGDVEEKTIEIEKEINESSPPAANEVAEIKLDAADTKDDEHSGKEGEGTSLPLPLGTEATEEPGNVAFCENEKSTESDKTDDSLPVISDNITAPDADQEIETSSTEEQSVTTHPRAILDVETVDEAIDAAAREEETRDETEASDLGQHTKRPSLAEASLEDANDGETTISVEPKIGDECPREVESFNGDNTLPEKEELQYAPEDHDASDSREDGDSSLTEAPTGETNADEPKDRSGDSVKAELENEKYAGSDSVKEEAQVENPGDCLQASDSSQDTESRIEEEIQTAYPQEISSDKTDTGETNEEILQENATSISEGDNEDHSPIEEDGSQKLSPKEATTGSSNEELAGENETNTECTKLVEEEVSNESMQVGDKDAKASALAQDREISSLEGQRQSLTTNPPEIEDDAKEDETNDVTSAEEETLEKKSIAETTLYEETEENLQAQVDSSQHEQNEDLGKDGETSSFTEPQTEDATESTSVKEEAQVEKSIDSLQVATDDVEASASCQESRHLEEQSLITDAEEMKTVDGTELKEETPDDKNYETEIPHEQTEENTVTQVDCLQKEDLEKDSENSTEASAEVSNGDESKNKGIDSLQAELENEENTGNTSFKEEAQAETSFDSLQPAPEVITASHSSQDTNTSIHEEILTAYPQEISRDKTEEEPSDAVDRSAETLEVKGIARNIPDDDKEDTSPIEEDGSEKPSWEEATGGNNNDGESIVAPEAELVGQSLITDPEEVKTVDGNELKEETPDDKHFGIEIPHEHTEEENSVTQVDCSQKESLEKDSENSFLTEASADESNANESKDIYKLDNKGIVSLQAELENEENTGITSFKEEALVQKPFESLQPDPEDITASDLSRDINISIEEKIYPQEISRDRSEVESVHAADRSEESLEVKSIARNIPDNYEEDSSPIEEDGSKKPYLDDELSTVTPEANLGGQNEKDTECPFVQEEEFIKSSHVEAQDIKAATSGQDKETTSVEEQSLNTSAQGIVDDTKEERTSDAAGEEETLEYKQNIAESTLYEETGENTVVQVDHSGLEQNEVWKEDNGKASISEAPTMDNAENILVKDEAQAQDHHAESLQAATEVIEAHASCQEASSVDEKIPSADSQEITFNHKEEKTIDSTGLKEETPEDKSTAATSNEETREKSLSQEDRSNLEHWDKDGKSTSSTEAPTTDTTESTLVKEEAQAGDHIDSLHMATDDIKAFPQSQEPETSYTEEQVVAVDPEDIPRDNTNEKTEVQDIVRDVPQGDDEDNSPTEEDGSQKPSFEEAITEDANDHESATTQEAEFLEERTIQAGLFRKEKTTEGTLGEEDASIEPPQVAAEDIKASSSSEEREPISQEEQILNANPGGFVSEDKQEKTVDPTDMQKETPQDEVAEEIEYVNTEATNTELKEEEGDFKDPQLTTAVDVAAPEEKDSNSIAVEIPYTKELDSNEDAVGHLTEDPSCKQEESPTTKVPEENVLTSNENISEITSLESEVSAEKNDNTVVETEKSCGDPTDAKEIAVIDDESIAIPTNETLAETDPRGSTEADVQVSDGEQKTELVQQDVETETALRGIEEQQLNNASEAVSESEGVNGEEEKINSDNCKDISESSNSVASEEISLSNVAVEEDSTPSPFQESKRQTREEAENEEAQEQEEEVHVSALIQDSSVEKVEKDAQECVVSAIDSAITQKMPELEEPPLPVPDKSITEIALCKETEVVKKAIENEEEEDGTKSLLDDKKGTGEEEEETESEQETTVSTSVAVANDLIPISASEPSKEDDSITEREVTQDTDELHSEETATDESVPKSDKNRIDEEQKTTDFSPAAPNMTDAGNEDVSTLISEAQEEDIKEKCTKEANDKTIDTTEGTLVNESTSLEGILVNNRSTTDLESKNDDEAPDITETTPTVTEGESTSVGELNEKKSDLNEVACEMGKQKNEYVSKNQVLESVPQDQSCETISDTEETKTEEKNLEAAAETKSGEVVLVDISEQEETTYEKEITEDNISGEKTEDEGAEGYHQGSCEKEVITESHLREDLKQEEEITAEKVFEVVKLENATEKVPETSKEGDDRAPNESHPQETEQVKSVEEVTAILDTKEAHELDITSVKTGTRDSNEEINSSSAALIETEDNKTRASDTHNEKASDEGLLTQESNIPEKEAAARELPKGLDENTICEAPPTDTVHNTIVDIEAKKEYTNTIVMQPQEEESTPKHEILPLLQSAQGKEFEEQNQKDESSRSDEVQTDFEDTIMFSARTNEEKNADTWGKSNEDEDTNTDVEAEKLDCSSRTKEVSEVSINNDAPYIPNDSEDFATKDKSSEESQIPTAKDEIEHAPEDTRVAADSPSAIPNAIAVQSQQEKGINDKCEVVAESKLQGLPEEFSFRTCEDKVSEKDDLLNLQHERAISEDVQGLIEESSEVSKKENPVEAEADEIENAPMSEAPEKVTEQHQSGRNSENVEEKETIQSQIDSLPISPNAKCLNSETAEKDPPQQIAGLNCTDATELEAIPPPSKDTHVDAKADEEKDDEEEQKGSDLSSEAPVVVDIGDADVKASQKKSHNILSGVGSKVKHSIAKVKKAITGKSSHPKPPSPKKVIT